MDAGGAWHACDMLGRISMDCSWSTSSPGFNSSCHCAACEVQNSPEYSFLVLIGTREQKFGRWSEIL